MLLLCGCGPRSLKDFREEGQGVSRSLIQDLKKIHSREDLAASMAQIQNHIDVMVAIMVEAERWRQKKGGEIPELTHEDHQISDALRAELSRVYSIDGARELFEGCQQEVLERLAKSASK